MKDSFTVERERYEGNTELVDSLEFYDRALREGVSALFKVWPYEEQ